MAASELKWIKADNEQSKADTGLAQMVIYPLGEDYILSINNKTAKRGRKADCKAEALCFLATLTAQKEVEQKNAEEVKAPRKVKKKSEPSSVPPGSANNMVWEPDPTPEKGKSSGVSYLHWQTKDGCYRVTRVEDPDGVRFIATVRKEGEVYFHFEAEQGMGSGHPRCYKNLAAGLEACLTHYRKATGTDVQMENVQLLERAGALATPGAVERVKKARKAKAAQTASEGNETPPEVVQGQETATEPSTMDDAVQNNEYEGEQMATETKVKALKVKEKVARRLFKELKIKGWQLWKLPKLEVGLNEIEKYIGGAEEIEGDSLTLLKEISEALTEGRGIKVVPAKPKAEKVEPEETPPLKPARVKPVKEEKATPKAEKGEVSPRPGSIVEIIITSLEKASEKRPVTKEEIVARVLAQLPDKDPGKVARTVQWHVPAALKRDKGMDIQKNEKGFWAVPSSK